MDLDAPFSRQSGLITRRQALQAGLSNAAIGRRTAAGTWTSLFPGVYLPRLISPTPEIRLRAALLWLHRPAHVAGLWAAWLHELLPHPIGPLELLVGPGCGVRPRDGVVLRRVRLHRADQAMARGFPVTGRARTALDCAAHPQGRDIVDRALQRGTTVASLGAALRRMSGEAGVVAARTVVARISGGEVSEAEREYARQLRAVGIRELQAGVHVAIGGERFWLDFACVRRKVAVEIDGWRVHSSGEAFHNDRRRQNALILDDWLALRFTPRQVRDEPGRVLEQTRHALALRAGRDG